MGKKANKETVDFLCKNLSPKLKRLALFEMNITDENIGDLLTRCKNLTELCLFGCQSLTNTVVEKILLGKNLTILTLPYKTKAAGLEKVNFTNILVPKLTHKLEN